MRYPYLQTINTAAAHAYRRALEQFQAWYAGSYGREPDAAQLTAEEAREWRGYLTTVKQASATASSRTRHPSNPRRRLPGCDLETAPESPA